MDSNLVNWRAKYHLVQKGEILLLILLYLLGSMGWCRVLNKHHTMRIIMFDYPKHQDIIQNLQILLRVDLKFSSSFLMK